ncbi:hypothetical protein E2C01_029617 [Portunus trituberculatus]|uniref:Uncharacterized protein n=1 Tax=Portunus trituberculatus TaxID=210409 RepID=A0A5B7ENF1_PORTR|nr:hypothetical protein [Portunus trituberculatus]
MQNKYQIVYIIQHHPDHHHHYSTICTDIPQSTSNTFTKYSSNRSLRNTHTLEIGVKPLRADIATSRLITNLKTTDAVRTNVTFASVNNSWPRAGNAGINTSTISASTTSFTPARRHGSVGTQVATQVRKS